MTTSAGGDQRKAVFLDRDGVINESPVHGGKPYAPRLLSDFRLFPGVAEAVADLKNAGFIVIVVTNQPDVGHGLIEQGTLEAMHNKLRADVPVDEILVCPHRQDAGCDCRKPKPGLILDAMQRWKITAAGSYMVGDRWNDVVAGKAAGLYTIFLDRGYSEKLTTPPDLTVRSLREAASNILAH